MSKKSKPISKLDKELSPEILQEAKVKADDMLLDLRLAELRELLELSQTQIADAMGIKQPTVASLEKKGKDVRLLTLKRYTEAAGCKLRIHIELPDGSSRGIPI